jgi:carboxypeptidase C (cathepsin A)
MLRIFLSTLIAASALAQTGDEKSPSPAKSKRPAEEQGDEEKKEEKKEGKAKESKPDEKSKDAKPEEKPRETRGSVKIAGAEVPYLAKTGTLPLLKDDGATRADVFFVYYAATGPDGTPLAAKEESRPIMFCFNGGPGSAAVWLHFGGLGPKKIELPPDGRTFETTGKIADNPQSVLDVADLVFLDPVGTGASRPAKGEKADQFWGVEEDIEACGEFIRLFTTRENRWMSPKFLCGESYGGLRGAGLCDYLQDKHGMMLAGFVCVSGVLNFATLSPSEANDLPYLTFLPTIAATAHFHGKLAGDLEKVVAEAREFAFGEYAVALLKGRMISPADKNRIATKLARFTGLSQEQVLDNNLRVDPATFRELLLRKEGKIVGRFDARVTAEDSDRSQPRPEFDPSFATVSGPFSAMANAYLRGTLGWESDHPYRVLGGLPWNYTKFANRYAGTDRALAEAMKSNPHLRILVCAGLRDLAVPVDATRHSIDHLAIPESLRKNIIWAMYESGHMMYLLDKDAAKLREDIVKFVRGK